MVVPGPRRRPPERAGGADDADLDVDELDAAPSGAGHGEPTGAPAGSGRGGGRHRLALVAAAVAGGLVAGALATVHERAAGEERLRAAREELSVVAGAPTGSDLATGAPDAAGWSAFEVAVPLTNRGPEPLRLALEGVGLAGVRTERAPDPVTVAAGETRTVRLPLGVRCAAFPPSRALPGVAASAVPLRVRVGLAERPVAVPLPAPGPLGRSLVASLAVACEGGGSVVGLALSARPAGPGVLRVQLGSRAADAQFVLPSARVGVRVSPGIVVSGPPMPWDVPSGRTATALLSVEPDCSVVGDGSTSRLQLVVVDPSGRVTGTVADPEQRLTAWLARQVALRCG